MEQPLYTTLKVNNEIELCEITDPECKQLIERKLLKERISYYIRWMKPSLFHRNKNACVICVNENVKEAAEDLVRYKKIKDLIMPTFYDVMTDEIDPSIVAKILYDNEYKEFDWQPEEVQ